MMVNRAQLIHIQTGSPRLFNVKLLLKFFYGTLKSARVEKWQIAIVYHFVSAAIYRESFITKAANCLQESFELDLI